MTIDFEEKIAKLLELPHAKPLSEEEQKTLYASAYALYNEGNYETAVQLFTQLVLSTPFNPVFWQGLASSEQMRKSYDAALHAWSLAALLNDTDPFPHFHAGECYLSLKNTEEAMKAFCAAEKLLKNDSERDRKLASKIELLKQTYTGSHATN